MESGLSTGNLTAAGAAVASALLKEKAAVNVTYLTAAELDSMVPDDWVEQAPSTDFVLDNANEGIIEISKSHLNMLYGTTVTMVVSAFLKALFKARLTQNPASILTDMLISVFVSQTVSREWAKFYPRLSPDTMFKQFEIQSARTPDPKVSASSWVANSKMNATALNILGQLIMASVAKDTPLGKKADADGTIFVPVKKDAANMSEYERITSERSKSVTDADRAAQKIFAEHATVLLRAVEIVLRGGDEDVNQLHAILKKLKVKNF